MQLVQVREAQHEEVPRAHRAGVDPGQVLPEEDEAADHPEHLHPEDAPFVEQGEIAVQRLGRPIEMDGLPAHVPDVLVVPDEHGERGQQPQNFQADQLGVVGGVAFNWFGVRSSG
ncbi:hypothetical protein [Pseudorhodoferax sp. Leaf267]|uniref:hypothetical protein n=1 Tax=Pseudorhodoferax sp. Leaf267 TaxID=1736316 RepID=UPI0012E2AD40|nr:hypothetical protein [Pseudorhodoferax sp. Leaf267]